MRVAPKAILITTLLLVPAAAGASTPYHAITSSTSPLTSIAIGNDLSNQLHHLGDTNGEVYPPSGIPADAATFVAMNGILYTADFSNHNGTATGSLGTRTVFTPISQTATTGLGTMASPWTIVTVVALGTTGVRITQTDSYIRGQESYTSNILISNTGTVTRSMIVYVGNDCYLSNSDSNYGYYDPVSGLVACAVNMNNTPPGRIEAYQPVTPGSRYFEDVYSTLWADIGSKQPFANTVNTTRHDDGMGLSWSITVPAAGTATILVVTTFSTVGHVPLTMRKTADTATVTPGAVDGYTVSVVNTNTSSVTLATIMDTLPNGFTYRAGTTTGLTTSDPAISGQTLTWNGPFLVMGGQTASLHFDVNVATSTGTYLNSATAMANGGYTVSPTGQTAPITVLTTVPDAGLTDGGGPQDSSPMPDSATDGGTIGGDGGGGNDGSIGHDGGGGNDGGVTGDGGGGQDGGMMTPDATPFGDGGAADTGSEEAGTLDSGSVTPDAGEADSGAVAEDAAGAPDAIAVRDAGTTGGGRDATSTAPDASTHPADAGTTKTSSGCSCSTAERTEHGTSLAWFALALFALPAARRRRR